MKNMLLNLKRLLKKRNNSGFTLVEVVIASMLLGILVTGVVTFVSPIMNMIRNNQKSAQATMLAETIDTYISGTIRGAHKIGVFTNTTLDEVMTYGVQYGGTQAQGELLNLTIWLDARESLGEEYEVRCLGINWLDDSTSDRKKLMVTNCKVDNSTQWNLNKLKILDYTPVFDDALFTGLFPRITLDTFQKQNDAGMELGTAANGYEIKTEVYLDSDCYHTTNAELRDNSGANFTGVAYVQCANLYGGYADAVAPMRSVDDAISQGIANDLHESYLGTNYYYPDTFIYYVVPKK